MRPAREGRLAMARTPKGMRVLARETATLLGQRTKLRGGEKLAWERWAPLVDALPGVSRWGRSDKAALARVIRAKGGPSEAKYVQLFDRHKKLRAALLRLAE